MWRSIISNPRIHYLRMRVIIAGAGEIGRGVATALRGEQRGVALIDPDPNAISESQSLDCLLVTGNALSRESLIRAGISDAEIIVFATNDDHVNLLGCAFSKRVYSEQVGDRKASGLITIAHVDDSNIMDPTRGAGPLEKWARSNFVVCPSEAIVDQLVAGLIAPSLDDILPLGDNAWIVVSEVTEASPLIGTTTGESMTIDGNHPMVPPIFAIRGRDGRDTLSSGNEIIQQGDHLLFVTGATKSFSNIALALGTPDSVMPVTPSVAIFGATRIGSRLARHYLDSGSNVVIIEPDLDSANEIVGSTIGVNKRLDVIHGDPKDEDLLRELAIENHDIAIATLGDDNLNISISMRTMDKGVLRTGLLLDDRALVEAIHRIGLRPVSKRRVAVTSILKSIHMHVPGIYQRIPSMPSLVSISADIPSGNSLIGTLFSEVERKLGVNLALVERIDEEGNPHARAPEHDQTLEEGDRVFLFLEIDDLRKVEKSLGS
ncbi:MAG: NAD-binding protein [Candidatus Thalassarchaeaceae archaeon]|nr:NAD-binding protein [Candidatus Thalassarchaeaceae archaeon]